MRRKTKYTTTLIICTLYKISSKLWKNTTNEKIKTVQSLYESLCFTLMGRGFSSSFRNKITYHHFFKNYDTFAVSTTGKAIVRRKFSNLHNQHSNIAILLLYSLHKTLKTLIKLLFNTSMTPILCKWTSYSQ